MSLRVSPQLEGAYTKWTLVRDVHVGTGLIYMMIYVDNDCNIIGTDSAITDSVLIDLLGNVTVIPAKILSINVVSNYSSILNKYVAISNYPAGADPPLVEVYSKGVLLWSRDMTLDNVDADEVRTMSFSPNGRYLVVDCDVWGDVDHIFIYEGS